MQELCTSIPFGVIEEKEVSLISLKNSKGSCLQVLNYGATLHSLTIDDKDGDALDVIVSPATIDGYIQQQFATDYFFGASIGRYAGRISKGGFRVENKPYQISHKNGVHLHGGDRGFDKSIWKVEKIDEGMDPSVTLSHTSPHLEEGYPGNLIVKVTYQLSENDELLIRYEATSDRETHVNLTNHAYFNLDGSILDHELFIDSQHILEVNDQLLPTGNLLSVENSLFDLNKTKRVGDIPSFKGYDDTFVFSNDAKGQRRKASLFGPRSGIQMDVYGNQPASVIFTPKSIDPLIKLKNKRIEKIYPAICFELQNFPDAPNHANFPNSLLKPGENYLNELRFVFKVVS